MTAIYAASLCGWGRLIAKILRIPSPFPFSITLGVAGWIFLGGILNLTGTAYPLSLDLIVLSGIGLGAWFARAALRRNALLRRLRSPVPGDTLARILPSAAIIAVVFVFSARYLTPPRALNFHDDLEKYLNFPLRMLATGSLGNGSFDSLGSETFGGQAFLQGFVAAHWPIGCVNAVDSGFALALCLVSLLSVSASLRLPWWFIIPAVLTPVFINPQYVNTSALYTAGALSIFLFLGPWAESNDRTSPPAPYPNAIGFGLIYAVLIALKTTFVFLAVFHLAAVGLGGILLARGGKKALGWAAKVAGSTAFFVLPWLLIYLPQWRALLAARAHPSHPGAGSECLGFNHLRQLAALFSLSPAYYGFGDTIAHYTFTMIFVAVCGLFLALARPRRLGACQIGRVTAVAACAAPAALYFISLIFIFPLLLGPDHGLRFLCPIVIAAAPTALIVTAAAGLETERRTGARLNRPALIMTGCSIVLLGTFYHSFSERVKQAAGYGSVLSFSRLARDPSYLAYNSLALSGAAREHIRKAQKVVPAGQPLLAWTPLAIHLDYRRNPVIHVDHAGLANPWLDFPFGGDGEAGIAYFRNLGVAYILWQYRGYAVLSEQNLANWAAAPFPRLRAIGVRTRQFRNVLSEIAKKSAVVYDDGGIMVLGIPRE